MRESRFFTDYSRRGKGGMLEVRHNPSYNVMYRKNIFLKEGGFLEGLWPGEDVELDRRLKMKGYRLFWSPDALVYHYKPQDTASFRKMMSRYGWAQGFLVRKYGPFRRIHFLPFIILGGLFWFGLAAFQRPFFILPLGLICGAAFLFAVCGCDFKSFGFLINALFCWHWGFFRALAGLEK